MHFIREQWQGSSVSLLLLTHGKKHTVQTHTEMDRRREGVSRKEEGRDKLKESAVLPGSAG